MMTAFACLQGKLATPQGPLRPRVPIHGLHFGLEDFVEPLVAVRTQKGKQFTRTPQAAHQKLFLLGVALGGFQRVIAMALLPSSLLISVRFPAKQGSCPVSIATGQVLSRARVSNRSVF